MSNGATEAVSTTKSREQTRAETRAAILESAEAHFLTDGYQGARLDEIAETAGYSKGAIYSNFASKDELFLAVSDVRSERTSQPLREALDAPGSAETKLAAFSNWVKSMSNTDNEWILVETEFTLVERRSADVAETLKERHRAARQSISELIANQLGALGITPSVDVQLLAETLMALESGLALSHAVDPTVSSFPYYEVFRVLVGYEPREA